MQSSSIPAKFPVPFASSAGGSYIRTVPQTPTGTPGQASFQTGFPPENFIPTSAGGTPPFGQDFNGLLNAMTAWQRWVQAGGGVPYFDGTFSTAIGGYPQGAFLQAVGTPGKFWISLAENNTVNPDTGPSSQWLAFPPAVPLSSNTTFYINSSTGNDVTGLGTIGSPWATLQKGYNYVQQNYNLAGYTVTFNCTGTFTAGISALLPISGAIGPQSLVFSFAGGSSVAATNSSAFLAGLTGCGFSVTTSSGTLSVSASGTGNNQGCGILASAGGQILFNNIAFGACGRSHINASLYGIAQATGNYSITGTAVNQNHFECVGGNINAVGITITGAAGLPFNVFAKCDLIGILQAYGTTFSGFASVAGQRYNVADNSVINTGGGGASYFPGTVAGSNPNGGQYI